MQTIIYTLSVFLQISEVPKILAGITGKTTHTTQLLDPFNLPIHLIFYINFLNIAEYENEDIPKVHLTIEELLQTHQQKNSKKRDLYDRSFRTDHHPCHSGKETSNY